VSSADACVVVDLEATCWQTGTRPDRMETIEIGAVKLEAIPLAAAGEFSTFVRPIWEPVLSEYCTQITSIVQSDVDSAPAFPQALAAFLDWLGPAPVTMCSWGDYDRRQLEVDCARHEIPCPGILGRHVNLKKQFAEARGIKPCGARRALALLGIEPTGVHHRALDDARDVAKIACVLLSGRHAAVGPN